LQTELQREKKVQEAAEQLKSAEIEKLKAEHSLALSALQNTVTQL
jgi:hypothetical protein